MPIAVGENFGRRHDLRVRRLRNAKRVAELVHDVLVGRAHASANGFIAGVPGAMPVRVDIATGEPRARLRVSGNVLCERTNRVLVGEVLPSSRGVCLLSTCRATTSSRGSHGAHRAATASSPADAIVANARSISVSVTMPTTMPWSTTGSAPIL